MEPIQATETGAQVIHTFAENGFIFTCGVLFVIQWPILLWLAVRYAGLITRYTEAQEVIADNSELHTADHEIIKKGVEQACQGVEYLKGQAAGLK